MVPLSFAGQNFAATPCGALLHGESQSLLVADLHLEKGSFFAARGQMLPPYDSRETLARLTRAVAATGARTVYALGDSYHDTAGERRLEEKAAAMLTALTASVRMIWITGNHDADVSGAHGGAVVAEADLAGIALRHQVEADSKAPEISGHFHPKWHGALRGKAIRRPCFVRSTPNYGASPPRLIMPAYGAYTGGMRADDAVIAAAMDHAPCEALLVAGGRLCVFGLEPCRAA